MYEKQKFKQELVHMRLLTDIIGFYQTLSIYVISSKKQIDLFLKCVVLYFEIGNDKYLNISNNNVHK